MGRFLPDSEERFSVADFERTETGSPCGGLRAAVQVFQKRKGFRDQWAKPIESGRSPELLATLRRRIRPLMLRRTKGAVAADLPPKQEQVLSVAMPPRHRAVDHIVE